ncbi:glycosyltransferase family 2 protein [Bdellovibrio sp. HCB274]|uniref:glycosyltransferase family 2 protein n=1 Tax=Bdellovibrio sp. HCB274 TaxID=3394361 RepID=UPI0039B45089
MYPKNHEYTRCIIILNWIYWEQTADAISELLKTIENTLIVVVENGSPNDSLKHLDSYLKGISNTHNENEYSFPSFNTIVLHANEDNKGFSGGVNSAISAAENYSTEFYFLLNNDAYIDEINLNVLTEISRTNKNALVGPVVYDHKHKHVTFLGKKWPYMLFNFSFRPPDNLDTWTSDYIEGSSLLFHKSFLNMKIEKDGYFMDERFFLYYEDVDLCLAAKNLGFCCLVSRLAKATHKVSFSTGGEKNNNARYYMNRNRFLIVRKWMSAPQRVLFYLLFFTTRLVLLSIEPLKTKSFTSSQYLFASMKDGIFAKYGRKDFSKWH